MIGAVVWMLSVRVAPARGLGRGLCALYGARSPFARMCSSFYSNPQDRLVKKLAEVVQLHESEQLSLKKLSRKLQALAKEAELLLNEEKQLPVIMNNPRLMTYTKYTVCQLRSELRVMGLPTGGNKPELLQRLVAQNMDEAIIEPKIAVEQGIDDEVTREEETLPSANGNALTFKLKVLTDDIRLKSAVDGVYTDGSCVPNPGTGGWACAQLQKGNVLWFMVGKQAFSTNNEMEWTAILYALGKLRPEPSTRITVYSDSNYCVRSLAEWAFTWKRSGWKKSNGQAPKNLHLVKMAYALYLERESVQIEWTKSHVGNPGNTFVDELANWAMAGKIEPGVYAGSGERISDIPDFPSQPSDVE
ncbi:hypothetical protein AB1Y20_023563 [Prymnesium parvum]|uniref:ribonuclease H n=1 Tax=Prymnesium parvum TaxID=97485 RepID=A0AB34JGM7_PRYPA